MEINMHAQDMLRGFTQTGTLGQGAKRTECEDQEAVGMVQRFSRDFVDIAQLDNTADDRNPAPGIIDLTPDAAGKIGGGFFGYSSCGAEFKGSAADPEEMTVALDGDSSRVMHFSVSNDQVTLFDAIASNERGHVTAGKIAIGADSVKGYLEELDIPWHMAK